MKGKYYDIFLPSVIFLFYNSSFKYGLIGTGSNSSLYDYYNILANYWAYIISKGSVIGTEYLEWS